MEQPLIFFSFFVYLPVLLDSSEPTAVALPGIKPEESPIMSDDKLKSVLQEGRKFDPPEAFSKAAHIRSVAEYEKMYRASIEDPEGFWGGVAEDLHWFKKWDRVLDESDAPF